MPELIDQIGRKIQVESKPQRIVSLVPSISELICDLGMEQQLVGITSFCVHPEHVFESRVRVGGTKNFKAEKIHSLQPDLIIANKEENPKAAVLELAERYPVLVTDVCTMSDAAEMISIVGKALQVEDRANRMVMELLDGIDVLTGSGGSTSEPARVLYLVWKDPFMAAGTDTYISHTMTCMGFYNVLKEWNEKGKRYPKLSVSDLKGLNIDYILLSSEPYPFRQQHAELLSPFAAKAVMLVDGEAFSWYGSRTAKCIPYLAMLAHDMSQAPIGKTS